MIKTIPILLIALITFFACNKEEVIDPLPEAGRPLLVSGVDISAYPEINSTGSLAFYDLEGQAKDFLTILQENGVNTIRLRLWVNPTDTHSSLTEVQQFAQTLRAMGFKIWLTLHYSDSWADPGKQVTPADWQGLDFQTLTERVYQYTTNVMTELQPDYIQIGNEINSGFLHPYGHITDNPQQFIALMEAGIAAVREQSASTEIIVHFAGVEGADWFFEQTRSLDYDIIGLSYYPIWHGKSLDRLKGQLQYLSQTYHKKMLIAETAYPFTLGWNDWTNNIVGLEEQLILPDYPPTPEGQRAFIDDLRALCQEVDGLGFCYWGAELVAWKGAQATDASSWENQALFDFNNQALPVLRAFKP